jgi:O-antigen ligase
LNIKIVFIPIVIFLFLSILYYFNNVFYFLKYSIYAIPTSDLQKIKSAMDMAQYAPFTNVWSLGYWVSIFLMSMIAFMTAQNRGFKHKFVGFLFCISVAIAVYGLGIYVTGNTSILWFNKDSYLNELTATFINRNSYATFAGVGFLTGLYHINRDYLKFIQNYQGTYKTRLAGLIDYISSVRFIYVLLSFLIFTALILTNSRAGISLTIVFSCVFYFLISKKQNLTHRTIVLLVAVIILTLIAPIILQSFLDRASNLNEAGILRTNTYKIVLDMIADYKLLGVGLGGFEYAFAAYRDNRVSIYGYWDKAHSTLLEIIVEIGIPLALLLFSVYIYLFSVIIKSYMRFKQNFLALCLTISGLCITHSCVDFSLQIPAINIVFHIMLALGYATAQQRR